MISGAPSQDSLLPDNRHAADYQQLRERLIQELQPGNNDISPAVQQGIYLGTIVLCSIELYFDRRNPEYLHVTAIRCFLRFHQCLFMLDVNIKQRRYTESCQYIIRSLADNLHICIYRKIPGLQSRNGL